MTGGDTGEGDEGDVEFRNARMYARAYLTSATILGEGLCELVPAGWSV